MHSWERERAVTLSTGSQSGIREMCETESPSWPCAQTTLQGRELTMTSVSLCLRRTGGSSSAYKTRKVTRNANLLGILSISQSNVLARAFSNRCQREMIRQQEERSPEDWKTLDNRKREILPKKKKGRSHISLQKHQHSSYFLYFST